jgi:hypothetical protein
MVGKASWLSSAPTSYAPWRQRAVAAGPLGFILGPCRCLRTRYLHVREPLTAVTGEVHAVGKSGQNGRRGHSVIAAIKGARYELAIFRIESAATAWQATLTLWLPLSTLWISGASCDFLLLPIVGAGNAQGIA